jgi:hypothetical protein
MLPDRERHALREIEAELLASDPAFAATLSGRKLRKYGRFNLLLLLCDVSAGALVAWHIARTETARQSAEDDTTPAADSH